MKCYFFKTRVSDVVTTNVCFHYDEIETKVVLDKSTLKEHINNTKKFDSESFLLKTIL